MDLNLNLSEYRYSIFDMLLKHSFIFVLKQESENTSLRDKGESSCQHNFATRVIKAIKCFGQVSQKSSEIVAYINSFFKLLFYN